MRIFMDLGCAIKWEKISEPSHEPSDDQCARVGEMASQPLISAFPGGAHVSTVAMNFDEEVSEQNHSEISCGPNCTVPKVLVGIVGIERARGKTVYVLRLSLADTDLEWTITRRYSEFLELRNEIFKALLHRNVNQCFGCRWFFNSLRDFGFPRKHMVSSNERDIVRFRKGRLDRFARLLAAHTFSAIPKCIRCRESPFGDVRDFFTLNAILPSHMTAKQLRKALVPERFAAISDPLKSKLEFRRGYGIFRVIQVEKPILVQWTEIEEAQRTQRLERRYSSSSAISPQHASSENVDLEEEKPASLLPNECKDPFEGSVTGAEVMASEHAVSLEPLTLQKHDRVTPRADVCAGHWDRWDLASPTRHSAKQA